MKIEASLFFFILGVLHLISCGKDDEMEMKMEHMQVRAHYPFADDYSDITRLNEDAQQENTILQHGGVYMDGNYLWDDSEGSVLWIPNIEDWDPDDFQLELDFQIAKIPDKPGPLIVLGYKWRWALLYILPDGRLHLAFNDQLQIESPSEDIFPVSQWLHLDIKQERDGAFIVKVDDKVIFQDTTSVIDHKLDNSLAAFHGGVGEMFHGYWRDLIIR